LAKSDALALVSVDTTSRRSVTALWL
jgi:hypothetical protein